MMRSSRLALLAASAAVALGGCAATADFIERADIFARKYAPIVGRSLVQLGDIIYQVECSPNTSKAAGTVAKVFKVVAPNSTAAAKFQTRVEENGDIAGQLCPLVDQVVYSVGKVPAGQPVQVITP